MSGAGVSVASKNIFGFDPRSVIPNCIVWFDASDSNTITGSGTTGFTWTSKATTSLTATVPSGSAGPTLTTYNGYPALQFNGSNTKLVTGSVPSTGASGATWICVATNLTAITGSTPTDASAVIASSGAPERSIRFDTTTSQTVYSIHSATIRGDINNNTNGIRGFIETPTSFTSYTNGSQFYTSSTSVTWQEGINNTFQLGQWNSNWLNGYINEVLIFNRALTLTEYKQLEGYLASKWGLQSQLNNYFLPTTISGCKLWFDATDASTVYSDTALTTLASTGGTVGGWKDKSGNAYNATQSTSSNQFTYTASYINGLNVMNIPATGYMNMPNFSYTSKYRSVFAVVKVGSSTSFYLVINGSTAGVTEQVYSFNGTLVLTNANNNILSSSNANLLNTTSILETINSSALNAIIINGVQQTLTANNAGTGGAFNTGSSSGNTIGFSGNSQFYMGEMLLFDTDLSSTNRQLVESYLAKKWGLNTPNVSLPLTHPYYYIQPYTRVFQPTDIPGCSLWLDAADNSTITLSGSSVTAWTDKSGYGGALSTSSGSSYYSTYSSNGLNGLPTITTGSASTSGRLAGSFGSNLPSSSNYTVFILFNYISLNGANARLFGFGPGGSPDYVYGFDYQANGTTNPVVFSGSDNSSSWSISPNSFTSTTGPVIVTIANVLNSSISLGSFGFGTPNFQPTASGNIVAANWSEMLVFSTSLTTAQQQQIQGYLAWKWGLNGQLSTFSPISLANCKLWLDAADTSTMTLTPGSGVTYTGTPSAIAGGNYTLYTYTGNGSITFAAGVVVDYLIIAGGGGGGYNAGGGGGAGGVLYGNSLSVSAGTYTITVGNGGTSGTQGGNSSFSAYGTSAVGGGAGGTNISGSGGGGNGGSGGGAAGTNNGFNQPGGTATSGQGNPGGTTQSPYNAGGGGGGIGSAGQTYWNGGGNGNGGSGLQYTLVTGSTSYFAAGGAGSVGTAVNGGGASGGGSATTYGSGGGGNAANTSGSGGSGYQGIVFIKVYLPNNVTTWTDKSSNAYSFTVPSGLISPVYGTDSGGLNSVKFTSGASGSITGLSSAISLALSASSLFIVLTVPAYLAGARGIFTASGATGNDYQDTNGFSMDDNGYLEMAQNGNFNINAFGTQTVRIICSFGWNGTTFTAYANSTQTYTNTYSKGTATLMALGCRIVSGVPYATGQGATCTINEVIAYSSYLSTTNRQQVESYLSKKWNVSISNYLPVNHPYRTLPPSFTKFSPNTISGLSLWLDAADNSTFSFSSGSNVSQWRDKSGNSNNFVSSGNPTYSNNAVVFNGNNIFTQSNSQYIISGNYYTIFTVQQAPNVSGLGTVYRTYINSAGAQLWFRYLNGFQWNVTASSGYIYDGSQTSSFIGCLVANTPGVGTQGYINGTAQSGNPTADNLSNAYFSIGATYGNTENYNGNIYEIIMYNTYVSTSQRQQVEGYLAWKWGLQSSLPSTHAYKKGSP